MLRVGLTGGIACGKSHVLARLQAAGCHTLDLDRVAHEVMAPGGSAYDEVVAAFGSRILAPDGSVDRKALGAVVFADAAARARLNAIVHPKVRAAEASWAHAHAGEPGAVLVTDAALLVESGVHLRFDRLVVVHCSEAEQRERLMARDGIDEAAARARIAAQMPVAEKRRFAHFEVDTSGPVQQTLHLADALAVELERLASAPSEQVRVSREQALGALVHGPMDGPRGLEPGAVLREIVAAGGLEMERLARQLVPPAAGEWYRAARAVEAATGPETLAAPVVLWSLARGVIDEEHVLAGAASLARLTHADPAEVAGACLLALAFVGVVRAGVVPVDFEARAEAWSALAARWGGAAPPGRLGRALRAAAAQPRSAPAAGADCARSGGDRSIAAGLVGMALGAEAAAAPAQLVADVDALLAGGVP